MGDTSSFSLQINNFESFLLKGFLPIPCPRDNSFTIMFFFILSVGIWFSFPHKMAGDFWNGS